jgi:hypothetical protein
MLSLYPIWAILRLQMTLSNKAIIIMVLSCRVLYV